MSPLLPFAAANRNAVIVHAFSGSHQRLFLKATEHPQPGEPESHRFHSQQVPLQPLSQPIQEYQAAEQSLEVGPP
jgi:hypothetical protein